MDTKLKLRVSGIIIKDNKILLVEMDNAGFKCLPGGHIELGEDSEYAMLREMEEETTYKFDVKSYLGIIENFFINKKNKNIHEIAMYYLLDSDIPVEDYQRMENDHGINVDLKFTWISLDKLDEYNIKPSYLKEILKEENLEFKHKIIKEN